MTSETSAITIQVFGANTDVGKTIVSTGLLKACVNAGWPSEQVHYIKPLQTGSVTDRDFVVKHTQNGIKCQTLFSWQTPVSPHLAAAREKHLVTDLEVLNALGSYLKQLPPNSFTLIETAGGVLSPGPSSAATIQADLYRPLRLPILLIGDGKLGGISVTLASYESLVSRGYDIYAIILLDCQEGFDNASAIQIYLHQTLSYTEVAIISLPALPVDEKEPLEGWFLHTEGAFADLLSTIKGCHARRRGRVQEMSSKAASMFWYPFTQHRGFGPEQISVVDSAHGDYYTMLEGDDARPTRLIDGCASWWTQGMGHGRADMSLAIGEAAGRYGHIIFPGNVHEPALRLAELLLEGPGEGWAKRVFFSDNGSTAMEIAVKMALKRAAVSGITDGSGGGHGNVAVITQQDCYHGDTLGCMDAAAPTVFNTGQHPWYVPRTLSLAVPTVGWVQGQLVVEVPACPQTPSIKAQSIPFPGGMTSLLDVVARDTSDLASLYRRAINAHIAAFESKPNASRLGAVMLEPVLMGAAGMILVDPLFQRILTQEGRKRGLPIVFDEVASGLYRVERTCAAQILQVSPDIACYGKTLTGGYLPMAVTLTTEEVFEAFQGPAKSDALLHGHSYTANPIACAASVKALETYREMRHQRQASKGEGGAGAGGMGGKGPCHDEKEVASLSLIPGVRKAVSLGTMLAVELEAGQEVGYGSLASARIVQDLRKAGVYARPLGHVVYLLASQMSDSCVTKTIMEALRGALTYRASSLGKGDDVDQEGPSAVVI